MIRPIGVYSLCLLLLTSACATAPYKDVKLESLTPEETGELFLPSENAMQDVKATLQRAKGQDKLALVILGGNWCHDSRALAARMHQSPLAGVIRESYETVYVDVGYLDQGRDVAQTLGIPIYYATPTVLIVEPESGRLVNKHDRHQWGAAESVSMDDSVAYFEHMASKSATGKSSDPNDEWARLNAEIARFEQRMAQKVERGYARVGPMLRAYKEGGDVPAGFEQDWNEVSKYRNGIPALIEALQTEARQRLDAGETGIALSFPGLEKYSWEQ